VDRYIGIPFVESGYSPDGCHCWGLVCLVYALELNVWLPRHDVISAKDLMRIASEVDEQIAAGPWVEVTWQRAYDVVLMRSVKRVGNRLIQAPAHFGIAAGPNHVLHVEEGSEAVCVFRSHPSVAGRILGAYRNRGVA
jgi:cell wall-associated NlpC family hydrolase